jgi:DNA/RNA-binding domain of Phe-tRNA-synthetase-like protein
MAYLEISNDVLTRFPGYRRGIVVGRNVSNGSSSPELVGLLRDAEASLRSRLTSEALANEPVIAAWREAFRSLGIKPTEYRPSIEALTRRVLKGDALPSISALVDIGTIVSLRYLLPVGAHAIDHLHEGLSLRLANGTERFTAFGSTTMESPAAGEPIFVDGDEVATRRWAWRQAQHTLVGESTTALEYNADGLPPTTDEVIARAMEDVTTLGARYCGGTWSTDVLSAAKTRISV